MELRQLRYFIAVAEERSFTRAAERLHISQPPLNRQMTQLEEELGVRLLDREVRPLGVTAAGRLFLEHALDILRRVGELETAVREVHAAERCRVSIGYNAVSLYGALPDVLRRIRTADGVLDLELHNLPDQAQADAIRRGEIDLGFSQFELPGPDLSHMILRTNALVLALCPGHPLTDGEGPVSLGVIEGEHLIVFPDPPRPNFSDLVRDLLARHDVRVGRVDTVGDVESALGLVSAQFGVALVPDTVRHARADLTYRTLRETDARCPVVLTRRHGPAGAAERLALCMLQQVMIERGWSVPPELQAAA